MIPRVLLCNIALILNNKVLLTEHFFCGYIFIFSKYSKITSLIFLIMCSKYIIHALWIAEKALSWVVDMGKTMLRTPMSQTHRNDKDFSWSTCTL